MATLLNEKYEALKSFLVENGYATYEELSENVDAVYNDSWDTFELFGNEYRVLTDEEADKAAKESIEESLWAFNAEFILSHSKIAASEYEYNEIVKAFRKMQEILCEFANALVKALIKDIDNFVQDAVETDGRGHFISSWDGEEHKSENFYIYRTN
jgi:hypothetical protein